MTTVPDAPATTPTSDVRLEIEALLPHYYERRDRLVWWRRRQLWLEGDYPQTVFDAGRSAELLEKTRAYYHPDPEPNF